VKKAPEAVLQAAAVQHGDPFVRRDCLWFLDHYADEGSTVVSADGLQDPGGVRWQRGPSVDRLCVAQNSRPLSASPMSCRASWVSSGASSPSYGPRRSPPAWLRLADPDSQTSEAIGRAADHDPDALRSLTPGSGQDHRRGRHGNWPHNASTSASPLTPSAPDFSLVLGEVPADYIQPETVQD
jgi:hypothetical protein